MQMVQIPRPLERLLGSLTKAGHPWSLYHGQYLVNLNERPSQPYTMRVGLPQVSEGAHFGCKLKAGVPGQNDAGLKTAQAS